MVSSESKTVTPDIRLLCDVQDGRAWEEFHAAITPGIQAAIRQTLHAHGAPCRLEDVEDLVQEVLLRLALDDHRLLRAYDPKQGALPTLLNTVARNAALDFASRRPRVTFVPLEAAEGIPAAAPPPDPLELPQGILTPREGQVLRLLVEEGLSPGKAAEEMKIARRTFNIHKSNLINNIRRRMGFKWKG